MFDSFSIAVDPLLLGCSGKMISSRPTKQRKELFDVGWINKLLSLFVLLPAHTVAI